jgi:hypothetical protein
MLRIYSGLTSFKITILCLATSVTCCAQVPSLSPLSKIVAWQGGSKGIPIWSGGAFVTLDLPLPPPALDAATSPVPTIYVSNQEETTTTQIRIPDAVWMQNRGIARGNDGTLAVCGQAKDSAGQFWSYLAIFSPNAKAPIVVHTDPYHPTALTIAPDGTIWTMGVDWTKNEGGQYTYMKSDRDGILRHFNRTGVLLGTALPQSGFKMKEVVMGSWIASSSQRVGWCQYTGVGAGTGPTDRSYFEVSADGAVSKTPLPPFSEGETIDSVAITESGAVLLSKSRHGTDAQLYALDRKNGAWQLVHFPTQGFEGTGYVMLGSTGNQVAFWTNGTSGFSAQLANVQ